MRLKDNSTRWQLNIWCQKNCFFEQWTGNPDIKNLSNFFKVSELVIIRRAYENNLIDRNKFLELLNEFKNAPGLFTKS